MSFDIFLMRFRDGESCAVERGPVREILRREVHCSSPYGADSYNVTLCDGTHVEFSAKGLESNEPFDGCAFFLRGLSIELAGFLLRIAQAGDMVLFPAMEGNPVILVSEEQVRHLPPGVTADFPPVVARTVEEMMAVLDGGVASWSAYRDHVLRVASDQSGSGRADES